MVLLLSLYYLCKDLADEYKVSDPGLWNHGLMYGELR